jgi:CHAD domain-containing protein
MTERDARTSGDRLWAEAGAAILSDLTARVRDHAKDVRDDVEVEPVHDMRTSTRRLRTAIEIYANEADGKERKDVEDGLQRIARRLGKVRDLDVLLETLAAARGQNGEPIDQDDLEPLRNAWQRERRSGARRLVEDIERPRFERTLDAAEELAPKPDRDSGHRRDGAGPVPRISGRAPALIWAAFGEVLAFEIDPSTADPTVIHEMRIAAKKLRYTLEAFEDALEPGATLIDQVTAVHDAGGEMHDAIVARDRARNTIANEKLTDREESAAEGFAKSQDRRAESLRPIVARSLSTVRSRGFRLALGRAVAAMGHISTRT